MAAETLFERLKREQKERDAAEAKTAQPAAAPVPEKPAPPPAEELPLGEPPMMSPGPADAMPAGGGGGESGAAKGESAEAEPPPDPIDAEVVLNVTPDQLAASMVIRPPQFGGADITLERIRAALAERKIIFGIQEEELARAVEQKLYNANVMVARGVKPIDGIDASIEDFFSREVRVRLEENEQGVVDYKNLNLLQNVQQGVVISKMIPVVAPVEGTNIFGASLKGRAGRPAKLPMGRNTAISSDGLQLLAAKSGHLTFEKGGFMVHEVLHISGDVNNAVGNIDFGGDVIVDGNVCEGYAIRCDGSVSVHGVVEGAVIRAKGDILLGKGMNGMGRGMLSTTGDVKSKFLENCTIRSGGSVYAESIVQSKVVAEDKIIVSGKRGVIVGGSCTATNLIEARVIGSVSNIATIITLGASPELLRRKRELSLSIGELRSEIVMLGKDIEYLERKSELYPLVDRQKATLAQKKMQRVTGSRKLDLLEKELTGINISVESLQRCRLKCEHIYPPTKIVIGNAIENIRIATSKCLFYFLEGQVAKTTL